MRRSVLFACAILALAVAPAFSANIGPVKSAVSGGEAFYGLGYSNTNADWEESGSYSAVEMTQNRFYGQFGYAFTDSWMTYLRAGVATMDVEGLFPQGADFEGTDPLPFVTLGANGLFFDNSVLSIGGFVQGTFFAGESEDSVAYFDSVTLTTTKMTATFDQMWGIKAGLQLQKQLEGAQLYGGPMYYFSEANLEVDTVGFDDKVEEEDNFGFVVGVQWQLLEDVSLDLEAQLRSAYDVGFVLNKKF